MFLDCLCCREGILIFKINLLQSVTVHKHACDPLGGLHAHTHTHNARSTPHAQLPTQQKHTYPLGTVAAGRRGGPRCVDTSTCGDFIEHDGLIRKVRPQNQERRQEHHNTPPDTHGPNLPHFPHKSFGWYVCGANPFGPWLLLWIAA